MWKPRFLFSEDKAILRNYNLDFGNGSKTNWVSGFPSLEELMHRRGEGYKYCNLIWLSEGYTVVCIDYIDLYKRFR